MVQVVSNDHKHLLFKQLCGDGLLLSAQCSRFPLCRGVWLEVGLWCRASGIQHLQILGASGTSVDIKWPRLCSLWYDSSSLQ